MGTVSRYHRQHRVEVERGRLLARRVNDCHPDKSPEWAASAIEKWYGRNREGLQNAKRPRDANRCHFDSLCWN